MYPGYSSSLGISAIGGSFPGLALVGEDFQMSIVAEKRLKAKTSKGDPRIVSGGAQLGTSGSFNKHSTTRTHTSIQYIFVPSPVKPLNQESF